MKALRNWMRDNEKLREIWAVHEYRQVSARVGDQMRDVILAMADVMEAAELLWIAVAGYQSDHDHMGGEHITTGRSWMLMTRARDSFLKAHTAAESVIKEVTR